MRKARSLRPRTIHGHCLILPLLEYHVPVFEWWDYITTGLGNWPANGFANANEELGLSLLFAGFRQVQGANH